jgi:hypothetical protein
MGENCVSAKGDILKRDENLAILASIFFLKKKKRNEVQVIYEPPSYI